MKPAGERWSDDRDMAMRARAGDGQAFAEVVRRYQGPVYGLCRRLLGPPDAEDAAQETFVRAFVHRERFDPDRPLLPWLFTIARRQCIDRRRKHQPELGVELELEADPDPRSNAEAVVVARQEMEGLAQALAGLPAGQREAVVLFHVEGLSYEQIATVLEVPPGTVMTWLHRGRGRLKQALGHAGKAYGGER